MSKVLVVQLARFGDIVQTKRLLLSFAAQEGCEVSLCVDESMTGLARLLYPFARVFALPAHSAAGKNQSDIYGLCRRVFAELRSCGFEKVYLLNFSPLSFALASLFEPGQLVGYARPCGQEMRGPWQGTAFNVMRDRRFAPINLVDLWAHMHPAPLPPEKVNPIPRQAGEKRIGIVMAGRASRRSLPIPVLAACVQAVFQARGGPQLVCLGSASERPLVRRLARELPAAAAGKIEDRTGQTSLTDLPELMLGLDLVLTPDTGSMHLGAHLGVPVQAFFLSSAWCWETGPYGFGHKVWQAFTDCSPCLESEACPRDTVCLNAFAHTSFLAHLAGKFESGWPQGLLGCIGMLDDLGVTYRAVDGEDIYSDGRRELRSGLAEYLGLAGTGVTSASMSVDFAEFLFREKDWMLPPNWPGAGCSGICKS